MAGAGIPGSPAQPLHRARLRPEHPHRQANESCSSERDYQDVKEAALFKNLTTLAMIISVLRAIHATPPHAEAGR